MLNARIFLLCMIYCFTFTACEKDDDGNSNQPNRLYDENWVVILNEGNFQWGNASISLYNKATREVQNGVFEVQNNRKIGDIAQHLHLVGDTGYLTVNNSSKVEQIDMRNLRSTGVIDQLNSPRNSHYFNHNLYVTDLYANRISVVNVRSQSRSEIAMSGWTEKLIELGDLLYVTQRSHPFNPPRVANIAVIDPLSNFWVDTFDLPTHPAGAAKTSAERFWVLCEKDSSAAQPARLIEFGSNQRMRTIALNGGENQLADLVYHSQSDALLYLKDGKVWSFSIAPDNTESNVFYEQAGTQLYSIAIDDDSGEVYVTDAKDFLQNGDCHRLNSNGILLHKFEVGIIPGMTAFFN